MARKVPLFAPAGITTGKTESNGLSLVTEIAAAPAGAGPDSNTVQLVQAPDVRSVESQLTSSSFPDAETRFNCAVEELPFRVAVRTTA